MSSRKRKIIHILNPVKVAPGNPSYLDIAQPVTFQSMRRAKADFEKSSFAAAFEIQLCTVQYPEDAEIIPSDFTKLPDLTRSVLDLPEAGTDGKKLPLISDIIYAVNILEPKPDDILVYTNADIGVQTHFYTAVAKKLKVHDAFVINRRELPKEDETGKPYTLPRLEEIYALKGIKHVGTDCFIFPCKNLKDLKLGKIFIGYPPIGSVLKENLIQLNPKFETFEEDYLTFHLGEDRSWRITTPNNARFYNLNYKFSSDLGFPFKGRASNLTGEKRPKKKSKPKPKPGLLDHLKNLFFKK